jgi:hypothetical protein
MLTPFSLRIFVADGDPDGLRVVERSNWIGKALIFPRAFLPSAKHRDELRQTGVYLLLVPRDDGESEKLYTGEGVLAAEAIGYRFSQDYVFTSPCTAAAVVLGRSANGRIEWKDARGRTLRELQAQEAAG